MLEFEVPFPPSVNNYKRVGRIVRTASGKLLQHRVNSDATRQFFADVWNRTRKLPKHDLKSARLFVTLTLHAPNQRKIDIDNRIKVCLDSIQHAGIYDDDAQIDRLLVIRGCVIPPDGYVFVQIVKLSEDIVP